MGLAWICIIIYEFVINAARNSGALVLHLYFNLFVCFCSIVAQLAKLLILFATVSTYLPITFSTSNVDTKLLLTFQYALNLLNNYVIVELLQSHDTNLHNNFRTMFNIL